MTENAASEKTGIKAYESVTHVFDMHPARTSQEWDRILD
jgi:hypothetical protein